MAKGPEGERKDILRHLRGPRKRVAGRTIPYIPGESPINGAPLDPQQFIAELNALQDLGNPRTRRRRLG